jgi:formate hydrogenlyase transcriptional activator
MSIDSISQPTGADINQLGGAVEERNRAIERLRHIAEGTAASTGDEFFHSLARHLADALRVRYCFVTECTDDSQTRVRALAFWDGQGFAQSVEYPLSGTPCEKVIQGNFCSYPERLQLLFPDDRDLVTLGVESYAGVPLPNSDGQVLGHLVVMDVKPRSFGEEELRILRIFATRAGVELERTRADAALKESESRLRALLQINNAIIAKLNRDELFAAIADALGQIVRFDRLALSLHDLEANVLRIVSYAGSYQRADYTPLGRVLQLDDSPAGRAFLQRKAVVRPNLAAERLTSSEERAYGHGFRSMCSLPLIARGKSIGAVTLGSLTPLQYLESGGEFLMGVANQIALAIDNMTAHEETEKLRARFEAEAVYLQEEIKTEHNFEEIIGQSAPLRTLLRQVEHVAPTDSTVLIRGESGTGKELVARAVHDRSKRKDRPLVKVNCGSIPSGLVESELFGHEKGAFTGATQRRIGRFELANGGTIFLDEVTELPLDTQVKLLRVLQEGEFERVGSSQTIKVDARVIAATNRELKEVVGDGSFRADLFYRLNVFPLEVPPLRDRREDIPLLVNFFISGFGKKLGKALRGVAQKSMASLIEYNWPGNIRELQNVIERAAVVAKGPIVEVDDSLLRAHDAVAGAAAIDTLENVERAHIIRALNETSWVIHGKKGAAEILGINPSTLRSRMEKLGIKRQP